MNHRTTPVTQDGSLSDRDEEPGFPSLDKGDSSGETPGDVFVSSIEGIPQHKPTLSVLPLSVIIFYNVSGGPFGIEESIRAGGAFYTLVGFLLVPFIWSYQESRITAELSVAFPHSSGGVIWCEAAFGPYAGWLNGMLSLVSGLTDNALYPVLFLDYLLQILPANTQQQEDLHPLLRLALLSCLSICMGYMNWRGLDVVGNVSILICLVAMSPFVIMTLFCITKIDTSRWFEMPSITAEKFTEVSDYNLGGGFFPNAAIGGVLLRPFLNSLFWNFNSFDSTGAYSEECGPNPERVIPKALHIGWLMVILGYFVPVLVAIGVSTASQEEWADGYMATAASKAVGSWLGDWTVFAAGISNLALYQAELSADVFLIMGMAHRRLLPAALGVRSRYGTPTNAIICATMVVIIFSTANLEMLIELLNFNYAIAMLMECAAFVKLRISKPDVPRPYRVPLNTFGCIIFLIPTFLATSFVMLLASYQTLLVGFLSVFISTILFFIFEKRIRGNSFSQIGGTHSQLPQEDKDVELTEMDVIS